FVITYVFLCFFFFSSRRRHTRSKRDWSSDVCSSDLSSKVKGSIVGGNSLDLISKIGICVIILFLRANLNSTNKSFLTISRCLGVKVRRNVCISSCCTVSHDVRWLLFS